VALIETDHFDTLELILGDTALIGFDDRPEPMLAAMPFFIEFEEPARLDPERVGLTWELPPASRPAMRLHSPLTSLAVHLLPLLLIIGWPKTAGDIATPIAVELVFEEPPPTAPETPSQDHPPGPLASEDLGDTKPKDPGTAARQAPPAPGEKAPAAAAAQVATVATPPPIPPPKPTPPPKQPAPVALPKPAGAPAPTREETLHEAAREARYAGPSASRDEYLNYLVTLTRQHIDLLPLSVIGSRHGETVVSVVVEESGAISHIEVAHSSGYRDIDERIAQMVAAVRKFPPLPQWYQGKSVQLELTLRFPDAVERTP
jgi:TonB family protein